MPNDVIQSESPAPSQPLFVGAVVITAVLAGLGAVLMVQTMPMLGWLMWVGALSAVGVLGFVWYRRETAKAERIEEDIRRSARDRVEEKSRAELRRLRGLRRAELIAKYENDAELVERIVMGFYWRGQSAGQLIDSLGNPADIDARIVKGRRREVWKYHPDGNRYRLLIALESDAVVDWEERR